MLRIFKSTFKKAYLICRNVETFFLKSSALYYIFISNMYYIKTCKYQMSYSLSLRNVPSKEILKCSIFPLCPTPNPQGRGQRLANGHVYLLCILWVATADSFRLKKKRVTYWVTYARTYLRLLRNDTWTMKRRENIDAHSALCNKAIQS